MGVLNLILLYFIKAEEVSIFIYAQQLFIISIA